jgi:glycosyltransferase involved in cell wall biosynthesis
MDSVVVPSRFTKKVLEDTGNINTPICVVNEAFIEEIGEAAPLKMGLDTNFNFLVYGQITGRDAESDRKNFFYTIKWLCEEFANEKDVGIVVKTNSGKNTKIDRQITLSLLNKLLKTVRKGSYPRVHLLHGNLRDEEVAGLYKNDKIKALVSATRGEGYGLPILEAAASDLPVIATDWSGHLDFMQYGKFISLDYDLREIPDQMVDNNIFMRGSKWAQVKESDFKKKVAKFRKSHVVPKQWATELGVKIRKTFSQSEIEKRIDEVLGGI